MSDSNREKHMGKVTIEHVHEETEKPFAEVAAALEARMGKFDQAVYEELMTQHDIRAGLYAPLRLLVYEDERGKTCVEYDRPSSLFGQFGDARVTEVATMLDRKLEELVATASR
jgi:hypothetical protein